MNHTDPKARLYYSGRVEPARIRRSVDWTRAGILLGFPALEAAGLYWLLAVVFPVPAAVALAVCGLLYVLGVLTLGALMGGGPR